MPAPECAVTARPPPTVATPLLSDWLLPPTCATLPVLSSRHSMMPWTAYGELPSIPPPPQTGSPPLPCASHRLPPPAPAVGSRSGRTIAAQRHQAPALSREWAASPLRWAHGSWTKPKPARPWPKCTVPFPLYHLIYFEFPIRIQTSEFGCKSNKFDKNMKSTLLFEFKYNLQNN
jgi:hypothetical protein